MDQEEKQKNILQYLKHRTGELPVLSKVATELAILNFDRDDFIKELVFLAKHDPPLALRLIRIAHSSFSGIKKEIFSLDEALNWVGVGPLVEALLSYSVIRVFIPRNQSQKNLWIHSIQTAVAASYLAKSFSKFKISEKTAYMAGLLHDIGRFVMFDHSPSELEEVEAMHWSTVNDLLNSEKKIYGFNHAELGWMACQQWSMPVLVSKMIRDHHEYTLKDPLWNSDLGNLIRLVQISDRMSVLLMHDSQLISLIQSNQEQKIIEKYAEYTFSPNSFIQTEFLLPAFIPIYQISNEYCQKLMF